MQYINATVVRHTVADDVVGIVVERQERHDRRGAVSGGRVEHVRFGDVVVAAAGPAAARSSLETERAEGGDDEQNGRECDEQDDRRGHGARVATYDHYAVIDTADLAGI